MTTRHVGPYELLDCLGEGGMGRVYRARDPRLDRTVAIKFLQGRAVADADRRMRFFREARAEAALNHPNIAAVLDVGEAEVDDPDLLPHSDEIGRSGKVPYLVLEYVPGVELRELIFDGPMTLSELLRLAHQIVAGLRAAHAAGIVHRDLKPANIRITPEGVVKILDFGLARFMVPQPISGDSPTDFHTTEGSILGTPPYLAPEQTTGLAADHRADLFAFGVILFQLASGELPFRGENAIELLQSTLRDEPATLAEKAPGAPPRLAALVARLLAKHPADRTQNAEEVLHELDAVAREAAEMHTSITGPTVGQAVRAQAPGEPRSETRRISTRTLAAAAATLALLVGAAFWFIDLRQTRAASALFEQGQETAQMRDPQAARMAAELFERAASIEPDLAIAWAAASEEWVRAYKNEKIPELLERADKAASRASEVDADLEDSVLARARLCRVRGDLAQATSLLVALLATANNVSRVHLELANVYEQNGDSTKTESELVAATASGGSSWEAWNALGVFRVRSGNYPGARAALERAMNLAPKGLTHPVENLASLLFLEGDFQGALETYEQIPAPKTSAETASNLGTLYYFRGRFSEAEKSFRRAAQIAPRQPLFHSNLADTLLRLNRNEEAQAEYTLALQLVEELLVESPTDQALRLQKALYLARSGDCESALAFARSLDAELSDSAKIQHDLARPFALCGSSSEALERLHQAVAHGYTREVLGDEDEFASLRGLVGFERLVGAETPPSSESPH